MTLVLAALGPAGAEPRGGGPGPARARVAELVRQLGDERFAVREAATEELWSLARYAEPALRAALADPDAEVAGRAASILDRVRYGLYRETPEPVAGMLRAYPDADAPGRRRIIGQLIRAGAPAYHALLKISESETDPTVRRQADVVIPRLAPRLVPELVRYGDEDTALALLRRAAAEGNDAARRQLAVLCLLRGDLEETIAALAAAAETPNDLALLVHLHRAAGDPAAAEDAARGCGEDALLQQVLVLRGDWAGVLAMTPSVEEDEIEGDSVADVQDLIPLATYARLAGRPATFDAAIDRIVAAEGMDGETNGWLVVQTLLLNDELERAVAWLRAAERHEWLFALLVALSRIDEAFAVVDRAAEAESEDLPMLLVSKAATLRGLGEPDEARRVLAEVVGALGEEDRVRLYRAAVGEAARLGADDLAREAAVRGIEAYPNRRPPRHVLSGLHHGRADEAELWWRLALDVDPRTGTRETLAAVADVMSAPPPDELVDQARRFVLAMDDGDRVRARLLRALAARCDETGRPDAAEAILLELVATMPDARTHHELGDRFAAAGRWADAARHYEAAQVLDPERVAALSLHARMLDRLGRAGDAGPRRREALLLTMASVTRQRRLLETIESGGEAADARDFRRLVLRTCPPAAWGVATALEQEARALTAAGDHDAALTMWERRRLNELHREGMGSRAFAPHLESAREACRSAARALVAAGRPGDAMARYRPLLDAGLLDVELTGELADALEDAGRAGEADALIASVRARLDGLRAAYPRSAVHRDAAARLAARGADG
ncbi:MAG: hypothetical protein ACYTG1_02050 [Planctomycetota bacterium]